MYRGKKYNFNGGLFSPKKGVVRERADEFSLYFEAEMKEA
jgi:hypothetical protein